MPDNEGTMKKINLGMDEQHMSLLHQRLFHDLREAGEKVWGGAEEGVIPDLVSIHPSIPCL